MMSLKATARYYELSKKSFNRRTAAEERQYKRLKLSRDADKQTLSDLRWKAELGQVIMTAVALNRGVDRDGLENVVRGIVAPNSKPNNADDLLSLIDGWVDDNREKLAKDASEQTNTDDNTDPQNGVIDDDDLPC